MAEPFDYPPLTYPVTVVGTQFCSPDPVLLTIVKKVISIGEGNFTVFDVYGNIVFQVKSIPLNLHVRHVLIDANGNPLLSMQHKIMTAHNRWQVFRGDSSDLDHLLFSTKKSSMIQLKTELDVSLAANTKEEVCDFKIKGSWFDRSCTIYLGDSLNVIAQMHKELSVPSVAFGKDAFMVTVHPNVDYAFIVALIDILYEIHENK